MAEARRRPREGRAEPAERKAASAASSSSSAAAASAAASSAASAAASSAAASSAPPARRRREALPAVVRADAATLLSGTQARAGLCLVLAGAAALVQFGSAAAVREVVSRFLLAEGLVQLALAACLQPTSALDTPYHLLLTACVVAGLFYRLPVKLTREVAWVLVAAAVVPLGALLLWHGVLHMQLKHHTSPAYWHFAFENRPSPGNQHGVVTRASPSGSRGRFALLHASPASLTAVLALTQLMVQLLEIGGMSEADRAILVQARNHFLFRVRHSSSMRHKAIATELLFRVVAGLLMQRTAQQMVEPTGPVSATLSFMEQQFSERLLQQSEVFIKPLPEPFDPDSMIKLVVYTTGALLSHKRVFKGLKSWQGGSLHPALQAAKYVSRFSILVYLTSRYLIVQSRQSRGTTPSHGNQQLLQGQQLPRHGESSAPRGSPPSGSDGQTSGTRANSDAGYGALPSMYL